MRPAASGRCARCCASGTTFECKKNRSSRGNRSRARLPSIDCRTSGSISRGDRLPILHLLVTRTPSGSRPAKASPTTISALPSPYRGARSIQLIPAATAACTVATHSSKVVLPHTMPRPPPPSVNIETIGSLPKLLCCMRQYLTIGSPEATLTASSVADPQEVLSGIVAHPFNLSNEHEGGPGNYASAVLLQSPGELNLALRGDR